MEGTTFYAILAAQNKLPLVKTTDRLFAPMAAKMPFVKAPVFSFYHGVIMIAGSASLLKAFSEVLHRQAVIINTHYSILPCPTLTF